MFTILPQGYVNSATLIITQSEGAWTIWTFFTISHWSVI